MFHELKPWPFVPTRTSQTCPYRFLDPCFSRIHGNLASRLWRPKPLHTRRFQILKQVSLTETCFPGLAANQTTFTRNSFKIWNLKSFSLWNLSSRSCTYQSHFTQKLLKSETSSCLQGLAATKTTIPVQEKVSKSKKSFMNWNLS